MNRTDIPLDLFKLKNVSVNEDGNYVFGAGGGELSLDCTDPILAPYVRDLKTTDYITRMCDHGYLKDYSFKVGKEWRIKPERLQDFLRDQEKENRERKSRVRKVNFERAGAR